MRKFFQTVALVSVFSISEKILGFLYRIFLSHSIGAEGIGLYSVALSVFGLLYTLCCSGIPITVSRLMTKYRAEKNEKRVAKTITAGMCLALLFSIPVCLLFLFSGSAFSFLFADERSHKIFLIILPGLTFTCVYSVLRGVFWGNKDFLPYSVIELLEEICMILVGIVLITFSAGVTQGALSAGIAVLVSYLFSFSLATAVFFVRKNKLKNPLSEFKPLLRSAMPITAMRSASSFAISLVSVIVPLRLISAGYTQAQTMSSYGAVVGQALPILSIPTTLIGSFTLVLIPEIAENFYNKRHFYLKRDVEKAVKFTCLLTTFFIPVFFVCGEEIGVIFFGEHQCGKYITATSYLMIFMSLCSLSTSILNSMGLETKTLIYYVIGGVLMLASVWFLPKYVGIYSLLIGFTFVYGLTTVLNFRLLNKSCTKKPQYVKFLLLAIATTIPTCVFGIFLEKLLLPVLGTVLTLFCCSALIVAFNVAMFFGFGLITFKQMLKNVRKILKKQPTTKVS